MADFTFSNLSSAVSGFTSTSLVANTNTSFIAPLFSGDARTTGSAPPGTNYQVNLLGYGATGDYSSDKGFLTGRRPHDGLLYPRGYYNK